MFLVKNNGKHDILDGQQRLTTLVLLTSCVRFLSSSSEFKKDLEDILMQEQNKVRQTQRTFRLEVRKEEMNFYKKIFMDNNGLSLIYDKKTKKKERISSRITSLNLK